jgi:hypothetical protein
MELTYELMPSGDWRQGPWQEQERTYEYGLHITAGVAINKFVDIAVNVMKKELQQMIDKKVWIPVIVNDLTDEERKSIIPSSIFVDASYAIHEDKKSHSGSLIT